MSRAVRLRVLVAAAATSLAAGCGGTGDSAQTLQPYTPAVGVNVRVGDVRIANLVIVTDGRFATVVAGVVNNGGRPDALTEVRVLTADDVGLAADLTKPVALPPRELVQLGTGTPVPFSEAAALRPGFTVETTLVFARAAPASAEVPIVDQEGVFAEVPVPTAAISDPAA